MEAAIFWAVFISHCSFYPAARRVRREGATSALELSGTFVCSAGATGAVLGVGGVTGAVLGSAGVLFVHVVLFLAFR